MLRQWHKLRVSEKCYLFKHSEQHQKTWQHREARTTYMQASTIQPRWMLIALSSVYFVGHRGSCTLRKGLAVPDWKLCNQSSAATI